MSAPIEITENDLFAKIGRLVVENEALRALLTERETETGSKPETSTGQGGPTR